MRWATSAAPPATPTRMPPSVSVSAAASPLLPSNTTITCHPSGGHPRVSLQLQPRVRRRMGAEAAKGRRVPPALVGCPPACRRGPRGPWSPCAASSGCCRLPTVQCGSWTRVQCGWRCCGRMSSWCAKALWLTVKASQCGWPCGWRDGCVCGWRDGWACGSGGSHRHR